MRRVPLFSSHKRQGMRRWPQVAPQGLRLDIRKNFSTAKAAQGGGRVPTPGVFKRCVDVALRDVAQWWILYIPPHKVLQFL